MGLQIAQFTHKAKHTTPMNTTLANRAADNIRILAAAMVEKAKSGHPGGAMGGADFINILYSRHLSYDPARLDNPFRDRFFLDPGHMSPMLYGVLTLAGIMPAEELKNLRQWGSITPGHPEVDFLHGIENTSGPLGQGHAMALGAAIAERIVADRFGEWTAHKIYTFISDGGIQEEISQGVGRIAGHLGLHNLIMFYDANNVQLSTTVEEVDSEDIAAKYRAWNWNVLDINGNDPEQIEAALIAAKSESERPTLIIGHTLMGKGARAADGSSYENKVSTHGQPLTNAGASIEATITNLGGKPEEPFALFPEVVALYDARREELAAVWAERNAAQQAWAEANPEEAKALERWFGGAKPEIDWSSLSIKPDGATRAASASVLSMLSAQIDNMVVSSADLSNSDKTDGFLKHTRPITKGDFGGRFLHAGVSELTMACIMNGLALHGGIIPACGTFFVFSDYMKPAFRLSALMRQHVIYVWSHDSFRVGEDGPTHQPIEHEIQLRLMEHIHNHRGERAMLVMRPADGPEAVAAWKMAMESERPVALVFSRQTVKDVPPMESDRISEACEGAQRGAYVVQDVENPDVVMIASGSEVSTLIEGADLLAQQGVRCRVVSVPSEGLFRDQSAEYQASILPVGVPRYGMTAGLSLTMQGLVGEHGKIHGVDTFGYSAPYKVLDEKFGFNGATVAREVAEMLGK